MGKNIKKLILLCSLLMVFMPVLAPLSDEWQSIPLVRDLIITLAARERMHDEFIQLQSNARLSPLDQSDFRTYINSLDLRIAVQCREVLMRYSAIDPGQLPCTPINLPASLPEPAAEKTPDEALAALDASLADGLAEFDEMLLSEQKRVAARPPRVSAAAGYETAAQGDDRAGPQGEAAHGEGADGEGEEERNRDGRAEDGSRPRTYGPGAGERTGSRGSPPKDAPDGSKDDVVARQLREAAEKESDPELKRKLWDEYHRYKASTH